MLYTRSPQSIEEGAQAEIPGEDDGGARGTVRRREPSIAPSGRWFGYVEVLSFSCFDCIIVGRGSKLLGEVYGSGCLLEALKNVEDIEDWVSTWACAASTSIITWKTWCHYRNTCLPCYVPGENSWGQGGGQVKVEAEVVWAAGGRGWTWCRGCWTWSWRSTGKMWGGRAFCYGWELLIGNLVIFVNI